MAQESFKQIKKISIRIAKINALMDFAKKTKDESGVSILDYQSYQTLIGERRSLRAQLKSLANSLQSADETEEVEYEENCVYEEEYEEYEE